MSCKYGLEDIIKYFEGDFPKEKNDEISTHLEKCKKCSTMYSSLALTKKYVDVDVEYKGDVLSSIDGLIDKNRYRGKKRLYFLDKLLFNNMNFLIGSITAAFVFICIIFAYKNWHWGLDIEKYVGGNTTENREDPNIPGEPTASPINNNENYIKRGQSAQSPDGEMTAEVIREKDTIFDSILITDKNKETSKILLENILYSGIESFSWIDNTRVALCGHVKPFLEVYIVIDAKSKSIAGKYDGIGFAWNNNKNRLYYVMTAFDAVDRIADNEGNIYYEAERETSIIGTLAISEDEEKFAFFLDDRVQGKRPLIICKMGKNKKLIKESEIDAPLGEIKFNDNGTVSIVGEDGPIASYDLE